MAEAAICYTGDLQDPNQKKFSLTYYLDLAKRIKDAGAHILAIKDMTGLLKPQAAQLLISSLEENISLPIHLHTHDTSSIQSATYLTAIESKVDAIDLCIASLSGLTAQPNFNSVVFFKGEIGTPENGFPKELQAIILKGQKPLEGRSNSGLAPLDMEEAFAQFKEKFGTKLSFNNFMSYQMYPKVFEEYFSHLSEYGIVEKLPTKAFFYGLEEGEEISVEISPGKKLIIRLLEASTRFDDKGNRNVIFELNGQLRQVLIKDKSFKPSNLANAKASLPGQIGSPLQGKLGSVLVKEGQVVEERTPLFLIEAMKMETVVTATKSGKIGKIWLPAGSMVEQDDLVLEMG